jgi:hypothetical protein
MEERGLDPEIIRANLALAQERFDRARAEYDAASRALSWWRQGMKLFGDDDEPEPREEDEDGPPVLTDAMLTGPEFVGPREAAGNPYEMVTGDEIATGEAAVRDLLPEGFGTDRPTLRQAIMMVMRANTRTPWTVADLAMMLNLNGWLPKGDHTKRITDMAGVMVKEGHLRRTGRGVYRLSSPLAHALESALPPITDYRTAAADGLPVPDHPAASAGLSDD